MPFRANDIKDFYFKITDNILNDNLDHGNLDILGIPVILYMAIMSEIDITKNATKSELYNRIFAEKGGIFDKFSNYEEGYDYGTQILRDEKNVKSYLRFLQEIAFRMFDNNNLSLPKKEEEIPKLIFQGAEISVLEFPIKHLFDNTITNIEFVHKSIFEYFVAEYIVQKISNCLALNYYKEKLASFFGKMLLHGDLSYEIMEFLKYKIRIGSLNTEFEKVNSAFQLMLQDGMTYYTKEVNKNPIDCELCIFRNMLQVVHLWENDCKMLKLSSTRYLKCSSEYALNLKGMDFRDSDLYKADLSHSDLREADLRGASLRFANLNNADLSYARLTNSDFLSANLRKAKIHYAEISEQDVKSLEKKAI